MTRAIALIGGCDMATADVMPKLSTGTDVSATLVDYSGAIWSDATIIATFVAPPNSQPPYLFNGAVFPQQYRLLADENGYFEISAMPDNYSIEPPGSLWHFSIKPNWDNTVSVQFTLSISTSAMDLSQTFTHATEYQITNLVKSFPLPRALGPQQVEAVPNEGQIFFNTLSKMAYLWVDGAWRAISTGGGDVGAVIPNTTNIISGDGSGNGADTGIPPADVARLSQNNNFAGSNIFAQNITAPSFELTQANYGSQVTFGMSGYYYRMYLKFFNEFYLQGNYGTYLQFVNGVGTFFASVNFNGTTTFAAAVNVNSSINATGAITAGTTLSLVGNVPPTVDVHLTAYNAGLYLDARGGTFYFRNGINGSVISSLTTSGLTLPADPTAPLEAATKQYVDAHAGGATYPPVGVAVSTGSAWDASIPASDVARLSATSNNFTGNLLATGYVWSNNSFVGGNYLKANNTFNVSDNQPNTSYLCRQYQNLSIGQFLSTGPNTTTNGGFTIVGAASDFGVSINPITYLNCQPSGITLGLGTTIQGGLQANHLVSTGLGPTLTPGQALTDVFNNNGRFTYKSTNAGVVDEGFLYSLSSSDGSFNQLMGAITHKGLYVNGQSDDSVPGYFNGTRVSWNIPNGNGNTIFINYNGGAGGGFTWYNVAPNTVVDGSTPGAMTLGSDNTLYVTNLVAGTLSVSGAKNFRITHPLDETKYLTHSCLEGPEHGLFYRGEAEIVEGSCEITLPDYFEALTREWGRSVLITQIDDEDDSFALFKASRVKNGKFSVKCSVDHAKFWWQVNAIRADIKDIVVIRDKEPKE